MIPPVFKIGNFLNNFGMRKLRQNIFILLLLTSHWAATGEGRGASMEISVRPTFNGENLQLDSLLYDNAAGEPLSVPRLDYFLR